MSPQHVLLANSKMGLSGDVILFVRFISTPNIRQTCKYLSANLASNITRSSPNISYLTSHPCKDREAEAN